MAVSGPFFRVQAPPWGSRRLWLSRSSSSSGMPARSRRRGDAYICALGRGLRVGLVKKSDSGAKKICPLKRGQGLYGAYQYVPCLRTERGYASQKNGPAFAEPFEGRGAEPISLDARRLVRITGHCPLDRGHAYADGGNDAARHFSLSTRFTPRPVSGRSQRRCLRAPSGTYRLMRGV